MGELIRMNPDGTQIPTGLIVDETPEQKAKLKSKIVLRELAAMRAISKQLEKLDIPARTRVVAWVNQIYNKP